MLDPAEVSKNARIRQFKEKRHFNIAAKLTFNTMISCIILLIARTARIACADRQTDIRDNYCNPRCACALRVNIYNLYYNYSLDICLTLLVGFISKLLLPHAYGKEN